MPSNVWSSARVSLTLGTFSIVTVSSAIIAAARIPSAAFLAPPMDTSPQRGMPPLIIYCSIIPPKIFKKITYKIISHHIIL